MQTTAAAPRCRTNKHLDRRYYLFAESFFALRNVATCGIAANVFRVFTEGLRSNPSVWISHRSIYVTSFRNLTRCREMRVRTRDFSFDLRKAS